MARTKLRADALDILEAGLAAVDTGPAVRSAVRLDGDVLHVRDSSFDLRAFRRVHVIGFGKASCAAAAALADILGDRICQGVALGAEEKACRTINVCEATHPLPSARNVQLSERLVRECETVGPEDLVLVIASGGGSAMLCWPPSECEQAARLYTASLRAGLSIRELNTVRKHLSALKGGGLAKLLSPATVVGLVFSDVPGGSPELVASGPTYFDPSTAADAQAIIEKYRLGDFVLNETPKDPALFRRVTNIMLVSNTDALDAMAARASELGYAAIVAGGGLTDAPESLVRSMLDRAGPNTAVVAGGEATLVVPEGAREGGRNQHVALVAARMLAAGQAFASLASDGQDNGPHAGALVDADTAAPADDLARFADTAALARAGDLIETGATGANVSDLMLLLQE